MAYDARWLPFIRARLDALARAQCPPLHHEDAVGLIVFQLSVGLIRFVAPKGPPLNSMTRAKCESIALEMVAQAHVDLLHRAGIVPVLAHPNRLQLPLQEWWRRWCAEMNRIAETESPVDDRSRRIRVMGDAVMDKALQVDMLAGVRAGLRASRREHGKPEDDPGDSAASFAAELWLMPSSAEKTDSRYFVRGDKIHISWRYVRDQQKRPHRRTVVGREPEAGIFESAGEGAIGAPLTTRVVKERSFSEILTDDDARALDSLAALEKLQVASEAVGVVTAAEVHEAIEGVVRELRDGRKGLGVVEVVLLDHVNDILDGKKTPTDLARERGLSERTFRDTWQRIRDRLAMHPRLKPFLRPA